MPAVRAGRRGSPAMSPTVVVVSLAGTVAAGLVGAFAFRSTSTVLHVGAPALLFAVAAWMFFSEHYERTLAVLALYLGLLDGYVKLKSGSTLATLGRDVLLYAIVAGAVIRWSLSRRRLTLPPMTPIVVVWVIICLAEVFNPVLPSIVHGLAGTRQHIEFVPLFFLGYVVMRSERRLMGLFLLLLVLAAVNGVVSLIQSQLTPADLAAWGPGYAKEVYGLGSLSGGGRVFTDLATGVKHVRPPALGSDFGFGGVVAAMAIPGALALAAAGKNYRRYLPLIVVGVVLAVVGLATSQAREAVVSGAVALIAFLMMAATTRGGLAAVVIAALLGLVIYFGLTSVFQNVTSSANRYGSIEPTKVISTTFNYREATLSLIPKYLVDYPLGAGIGSTGPAGGSSIGGGSATNDLDAESEPTFLIIELGIPGLIAMFVLMLSGIWMGVRLRAVADRRLQYALAAITAVLISFLASWVVGIDTANSPTAPFIWLALGTLAYWYGEMRSGRVTRRSQRIRATLEQR